MQRKLFIFMFIFTLILSSNTKLAFSNNNSSTNKKISILIPGNEKDNGFMEAAFRGYTKIKNELPVDVDYISNVSATSDEEVLLTAMRELASKEPDMIIAHGGQCNNPAKIVSNEYPNIKFVVIQGNVKGENLSSYVVDQEQSAWLAGALAGLTTKTNIVGHISGAWPIPGVKARAAFYDGLKYTNNEAQFLTWFTGNLDDLAINKLAAESQIEKGADVIYTMLNGGRTGVIDAMSQTKGKVKGIGNVIDWVKVNPEIFIGSAIADSSVAIYNTVSDYINGDWKPNQMTVIGLEHSDVVNISMSDVLSTEVKVKINDLKNKIISGDIKINTTYNGLEFYPKTAKFVDQSFKDALKKNANAQPGYTKDSNEILIKVIVDGENLEYDVPPMIKDSKLLLPMRTIFEALGCIVEWNEEKHQITAKKDKTEILLTVGSDIVYINNVKITLDVPVQIHNNRAFVPLNFVADTFKKEVVWDQKTQTVNIK